jgi:hypothetical protein
MFEFHQDWENLERASARVSARTMVSPNLAPLATISAGGIS